MPSSNFDEERDYVFADRAVALRKQAALTQRELGALLRVSERAVRAWEAGLSYPGAERLGPLLALYLERGVFAAGHEEEEAAALWEGGRALKSRGYQAAARVVGTGICTGRKLGYQVRNVSSHSSLSTCVRTCRSR